WASTSGGLGGPSGRASTAFGHRRPRAGARWPAPDRGGCAGGSGAPNGARLPLAASNPLSTQDDIAAALAAEPGVVVQARSGVDRGGYYEHLHRALDSGPDLVMDDGCDLVHTLPHTRSQLIR